MIYSPHDFPMMMIVMMKVGQKCGEDGCWSGSRYGEKRLSSEKAERAAEKLIHDVMEDRREEL